MWTRAPGDRDLLERALAARRRAGAGLPRRLLDAQVHPTRQLVSNRRFKVKAELPSGAVVQVGRLPGHFGRPVEIPPHRRWWVEIEEPPRSPGELEGFVRELEAQQWPGLALDARRLYGSGLEPLARLTQLETLVLKSGKHVTDGALRALVPLRQLTRLVLWDCKALGDDAAEFLAQLCELTTLELPETQLGDQGLARLIAHLPHLSELNLTATLVGDRGVQALGQAEQLSSLTIDRCTRVGDEGVRGLAALRELRRLNLLGCWLVTDEGAAALASLPALRLLVVSRYRDGMGIRPDLADDLTRELSDCVVLHRYDHDAWQAAYPWNVVG